MADAHGDAWPTATPGHVMLTPDGGFAELAAMLSPFASSAAAMEAAQAMLDDDRAGEGADATGDHPAVIDPGGAALVPRQKRLDHSPLFIRQSEQMPHPGLQSVDWQP